MGIITKIELQKKNKGRVSLFVDGEFVCSLSLETIMQKRLKAGKEIDADEIRDAVCEDEKKRAFGDVLDLISRKPSTKKQARQYLEKKSYMEQAVDCAIAKAEEYGYIDDGKYAEQYLSFYGAKSGKFKLKFDLANKGVDRALIDEILDGHDDGDAAYGILQKYLRGEKPADKKEKERATRYLLSKGCTFEAVKRAFQRLDEVKNGDDGE
ncbi:MAG: RecX family transcriptional regulator [Clostridiales bacterium]|nr:RecX family transcriptional regulator [Clostridiales bacterium]